MFHTILTLSYLIPSIYLFFRIWQLFIPRDYRLFYFLIYALCFSVYPLSNLLEQGDLHILETVSNYLLPFFLYLFLFVLLTDLLLLVNLVFKFIPVARLKARSVRVSTLLLIISLSAFVVLGGVINFNTIRTSEYQIDISRRSSESNRLRIAFVSDFHLQEGTPLSFVQRFTQKIKDIDPDLMLFGGDIVEGDDEDENMEKFENLFRTIKTKYGVYGVLGNHEHYSGQDQGNFFDRAGITLLRDSSVFLDSTIILTGRNDSHTMDRKSVGELMASVPDSIPVILIDHRPTEIDEVSRTHADIQFSGHTHHGQLFPINLITKRVYRLSWGYRKTGNTHFFVSSGIRLWGPPVRTTGKSEIMVVDVRFF